MKYIQRKAWKKKFHCLNASDYGFRFTRFRKMNIRITKTPGHYAGMIDALAEQTPGFLSAPFMNVLSYAAIMEYDFYNGENKDALALKTLGQQGFDQNRTRRELAARGGA